jgi:hypothetical protein
MARCHPISGSEPLLGSQAKVKICIFNLFGMLRRHGG